MLKKSITSKIKLLFLSYSKFFKPTKMNRRDILKYTALATGAAISAPLTSILLSGCKTEPPVENYLPKFFQKKEFELVKKLIDLILPKMDSPSASEVGVHQTIDRMIAEVYDAEKQADFKRDFAAFAENLNAAGFSNLKNEGQIDFLQKLELSESPASEKTGTEKKQPRPPRDVFIDLKQQTISYYLSTEEISTRFLNYLPVPGEYQPCISLEEAGGRKWAI